MMGTALCACAAVSERTARGTSPGQHISQPEGPGCVSQSADRRCAAAATQQQLAGGPSAGGPRPDDLRYRLVRLDGAAIAGSTPLQRKSCFIWFISIAAHLKQDPYQVIRISRRQEATRVHAMTCHQCCCGLMVTHMLTG